jgi:response regulator RpfG family c-di-GMP phosphodiesterase
MGGKSLVEQMMQLRPGTRVLYMSGYPNDGIVQAGILASGVTLLEKPFTREILSKRVRQVLDAPREHVDPRVALCLLRQGGNPSVRRRRQENDRKR